MTQHTEKLEGLLYAQAMSLAEQHLQKGRQTSEQIKQELQAKLQQLEQGEELRYQLEAEQLCRQILQASKIRMDTELDRLRWALIQGVLADVRSRLEKLAENPDSYHPVLERYLAEAARVMPEGDLVAELSARDLEGLRTVWERMVEQAVPGRKVTLAPLASPASGGMVVRTGDGKLRVDNTFEGRLARMEDEVLGLIIDRLFQAEDKAGSHG